MEGDLANIENIRRTGLDAQEGDTLVLEAAILDPSVNIFIFLKLAV